jgi:hypothetical protein
MVRTRSAGVEVYDQINKVKQSLYVSNNSSHVILISMNGMLFFDVSIAKWKVVNQFKGAINFSYDARFFYKNMEVTSIKLLLAMRLKISKFSEKLEFQSILINLEDAPPSIKLANLLQIVKIPFEFINRQDKENCNPLTVKILNSK